MDEKIELIRKLEATIGFEKFKVDIYSPEEEVNQVLSFILMTADNLFEQKSKIEKLLNE